MMIKQRWSSLSGKSLDLMTSTSKPRGDGCNMLQFFQGSLSCDGH